MCGGGGGGTDGTSTAGEAFFSFKTKSEKQILGRFVHAKPSLLLPPAELTRISPGPASSDVYDAALFAFFAGDRRPIDSGSGERCGEKGGLLGLAEVWRSPRRLRSLSPGALRPATPTEWRGGEEAALNSRLRRVEIR